MSLRQKLMLWHPELPDWMGEYLGRKGFAWADLAEGRLSARGGSLFSGTTYRIIGISHYVCILWPAHRGISNRNPNSDQIRL